MGLDDKLKNKAEELIGEAKEKVGEHRNDPDLVQEGQAEQGEAELKQAGEKIKDFAKDAKEKMTD